MNEDFVTYELAVKLKEKGFREKCLLHYESTGGFYSNSIDTYDRPNQELDYSDFLKCFNEGNSIGLIDAPTISQVLRWLRQEKKIYLELVIVVDAEYMCDIYKIGARPIECLGSTEYYKTYEQATLAGIEYVLDNLI